MSSLLSVQIIPDVDDQSFQKKIQFTIKVEGAQNEPNSKQNFNYECTFLHRIKASTNGQDSEYQWKTDGCRTLKREGKLVTCECTHTTTFAVLLYSKDYQSQVKPRG